MEKKNPDHKPIIGFTLGDVNGIGSELILRTLNDTDLLDHFIPVVYGSSKVLNYYKKIFPQLTINIQSTRDIPSQIGKNINVVNCWEDQVVITPGEFKTDVGKYAALSLVTAAEALKNGKIDALVTAPIHKRNIKSPQFDFIGHTPFLKHFFNAPDAIMLMVSENMRVALLTEHLSIKDISNHLSIPKILDTLKTLNKSLEQDFLISRPRIAVLGLNPHCGDGGLVGREDIDIIEPAIKQALQHNIFAFGPYSADAFFARAAYKEFDAILAMYHDQGLIPFKSLSIGEGINFTAGLGVVRTSPDHGTAFDIVGKNIADLGSFRKAIFDAIDIVQNRKQFKENTQNPLRRQSVAQNYSLDEDKGVEDIKEILS